MILQYEPASEPLRISRRASLLVIPATALVVLLKVQRGVDAQDYESRLTTMSRGSQPSHLGSHLVAGGGCELAGRPGQDRRASEPAVGAISVPGLRVVHLVRSAISGRV